MEDFFRKYGLIDDLTFSLKTDQVTFARKLAAKVDPGQIGLFSGAFEVLESSKNDYKGQITNKGFRIRNRKSFFRSNGIALPVAEGRFREEGDKLIIDARINTNTKFIVPALVGLALFYLVFIFVGLFAIGDSDSEIAFFVLPFVLLHMSLMIFLPYYIIRKAVGRMKKDLERDFFFIANADEAR